MPFGQSKFFGDHNPQRQWRHGRRRNGGPTERLLQIFMLVESTGVPVSSWNPPHNKLLTVRLTIKTWHGRN